MRESQWLFVSYGRGVGNDGMVKIHELLINAVTANRLKRLTSLPQKGRGQVRGLLTPPTQMLHYRRRGSTYVFREGFVWNAVSPNSSLGTQFFFSGNAIRKESRWGCGYGSVEDAKGVR